MGYSSHEIFNRVELLVGRDGLGKLGAARAIVVGVGGVGSWAAESLARTGVGHITLVDADTVAVSNINRQLMALQSTVGAVKTEVLAGRLRDINPEADIIEKSRRFTALDAGDFDLGSYDVVIDAIDSLADKAALIVETTRQPGRVKLFSSMGAALRLDPSRVRAAEFWKVTGDPLAAALRRRFRKSGIMPRRRFTCVYSDELLCNHPGASVADDGAMSYSKRSVNGAVAHITAIFGFTLAGLAVNAILRR